MFVQAIGTIDTWLLTISVEKAGIKMKHKYFQVFYQQKKKTVFSLNSLNKLICCTLASALSSLICQQIGLSVLAKNV